MTVRNLRKAQPGQYNSNCALYGYKKSKEDKHKLVIEPEGAEVVREIFNMKIAGTRTTLIARALNDRGIPCSSELYRFRGDTRQWKNKGNPIERQARLKPLYGIKSIPGQWYS